MQKTWRATMLISIVALIILFSSHSAQAYCTGNNHVRPADIVADEVNKLFEAKNYKKLDELARLYEKERRSTFDSLSSLMAFYDGIAYGFNTCAKVKKSEDEWAAHRQALIAWIDASPNSIAAKLALALFSIEYGWHGRGSGYASTVDEKSWAVFRERISSAKSQLDDLELGRIFRIPTTSSSRQFLLGNPGSVMLRRTAVA